MIGAEESGFGWGILIGLAENEPRADILAEGKPLVGDMAFLEVLGTEFAEGPIGEAEAFGGSADVVEDAGDIDALAAELEEGLVGAVGVALMEGRELESPFGEEIAGEGEYGRRHEWSVERPGVPGKTEAHSCPVAAD